MLRSRRAGPTSLCVSSPRATTHLPPPPLREPVSPAVTLIGACLPAGNLCQLPTAIRRAPAAGGRSWSSTVATVGTCSARLCRPRIGPRYVDSVIRVVSPDRRCALSGARRRWRRARDWNGRAGGLIRYTKTTGTDTRYCPKYVRCQTIRSNVARLPRRDHRRGDETVIAQRRRRRPRGGKSVSVAARAGTGAMATTCASKTAQCGSCHPWTP
jgi:hypothetical protein